MPTYRFPNVTAPDGTVGDLELELDDDVVGEFHPAENVAAAPETDEPPAE